MVLCSKLSAKVRIRGRLAGAAAVVVVALAR